MSMQPNEADVTIERDGEGTKPVVVHVVDLPGHPRLIDYFYRNVASAKGVVFVVDSISYSTNSDDVARYG